MVKRGNVFISALLFFGLIFGFIILALSLKHYFPVEHENKEAAENEVSHSVVEQTDFLKKEEYFNTDNGFILTLPQNWVVSKDANPKQPAFRSDDERLEVLIIIEKVTPNMTLDKYLVNKDKISSTAYEGKPSVKVVNTKPISLDGNDAIERNEKWLAAGFDAISTYTIANEKAYWFSLRPLKDAYLTIEDQNKYQEFIKSFRAIAPHKEDLLKSSTSKTVTTTTVEQFCGGIANIKCPTGFKCQLGGDYPDTSGKCVK